jgi:hypothetical protein
VGVPLLYSFIGVENSAKFALIVMFTIPLYNILASLVLSIYSEKEKPSVKSVIIGIISNPLTIGIMIGITMSALNLRLPSIADSTIGYFVQVATPLALLCLGGALELTKYNPKIKYSIWAAVSKSFLQPVTVCIIAYLLGFRSYDLVVLMVAFAVPTAISSYTMTVQMGGEEYVASANVILSTFMCIFTLTGFVYFFKVWGLV